MTLQLGGLMIVAVWMVDLLLFVQKPCGGGSRIRVRPFEDRVEDKVREKGRTRPPVHRTEMENDVKKVGLSDFWR